MINPLTPMSHQDKNSSYDINTISTGQVMRIKKNINLGIIGWSNTKFSELTLYKNCLVDSKENYKFDLEVRGFRDVLTAFWCPLWSITKQTNSNMESISIYIISSVMHTF